jgi:hypothetical protein
VVEPLDAAAPRPASAREADSIEPASLALAPPARLGPSRRREPAELGLGFEPRRRQLLDVDLGQHLALLDQVALAHAHLFDAARALRGDVVLGGLDAAVAGGEARRKLRLTQPVVPIGGAGDRRDGERADQQGEPKASSAAGRPVSSLGVCSVHRRLARWL